MRLSPVWVAIAAIASFRQAALTQVPAAYAAPLIPRLLQMDKPLNHLLEVVSQKYCQLLLGNSQVTA